MTEDPISEHLTTESEPDDEAENQELARESYNSDKT